MDAAEEAPLDEAWQKLVASGGAVSREQVQECFHRNIGRSVSDPSTAEDVRQLDSLFRKISELGRRTTAHVTQAAQKKKAAPARLLAATPRDK